MITLRTLLAGLAACLPRDEAEAVRTAARAEISTRMREPAPVLRDPLTEDDQVLEVAP